MPPDPTRVASRALAERVTLESVKMYFYTVDEWHSTHLEVTLASPERLSDQAVEAWLQEHWREVVSQAPWKPPAPAPDYSAYSQGSYGDWDDDEDEDGDGDGGDTSELPEPGLGWINPHHEPLRTAESVKIKHPRPGVIQVDIGWGHR